METKETRGKYFVLATKEVTKLADQLVRLYHTDMDSIAAKVDVLFCFRAEDSDEPALAKDGSRVLSVSKVTSLKDRVKGMGDVEIILDGDAWGNLDDKGKAALLDHALESFEAKRDKEGDFVLDDIDRPTFRIRPHDRVVRFYDAIAQRHRSDSMEVKQLQRMFAESGQIYLPFIDKSGELTGDEKEGGTVSIRVGDAEPVEMTHQQFTGLVKKRFE